MISNHRGTETQRIQSTILLIPFSHDVSVEIDRQALPQVEDSHIRQDLRLMDRSESVDGLDLDDDFICNDEIWSMFGQQATCRSDGNSHLSTECKPWQFELHTERFLVRILGQARSEMTMNLDGAADDFFRKRILSNHQSRCLCVSVVRKGED